MLGSASAAAGAQRRATDKAETLLDLSGRALTTLPSLLPRYSGLTALYIAGNKLKDLPAEIFTLSHLEILCASNNFLSDLPDAVKDLLKLSHLCLGGNQFREVPKALQHCTALKVLNIKDNPIQLPLSTSLTHLAKNSWMPLIATIILFSIFDNRSDLTRRVLVSLITPFIVAIGVIRLRPDITVLPDYFRSLLPQDCQANFLPSNYDCSIYEQGCATLIVTEFNSNGTVEEMPLYEL